MAVANPRTALRVAAAFVAGLLTRPGLRPVGQPEAGQRHAGEADAEFLQRRAARDGLGQALGQFIELVVHNVPFSFGFSVNGLTE